MGPTISEAGHTAPLKDINIAQAFENIPALMSAFDENLKYVVWNKECERVTGYTAKEMVGNPFALNLLYPDQDYLNHLIADWKRLGDYKNYETIITCKDGSKKVITWSKASYQVPIDGWHSWGIGHDITKKVEAQRAKEEAQKQTFHTHKLASLSQLAAGMAHEINNPLAIIKCSTDLLQLKNDNLKNNKSIDQINSSIKRISGIVKGLLKYGRNEYNANEYIDIHQVIEESILLAQALYRGIDIDYVQKFGAKSPIIKGNPGQFQQIIMNLISNAKDALQECDEKKVTISTYNQVSPQNQEKQIVIEFSDTGCGIPEDNLEKVFEPFFTTKEVNKGTGLGLGIIHSLTTQMKGELKLDSQVNAGTTFTLSFTLNLS